MFFLVLLWLCIGTLVGFIANAAQLRPASWQPFGWLRMAALGALIAFCGGWLGILLLGRPFATGMALWISVIGVVSVPWLMQRRGTRLSKKQAKPESSSLS
jgi:uncharacterized membrane protein YeaQ/YmgE (transglycosylase-associated protein family)